jgi:RING-type zinc-finger
MSSNRNSSLQLVSMDHSSHRRQVEQQSFPDARFSCSICTEAVIEPVVTHCGHLYCWPCLYRWLEPGMTPQERNDLMGLTNVVSLQSSLSYDPSKRVCPVCRAPCSVKRVIPIYVRTDTTTTTAAQQASVFSSNNRFTSIESATNTNDVINNSNNDVDGAMNERDQQILVETVEDIVVVDEGNVTIPDDNDDDDEHDFNTRLSEESNYNTSSLSSSSPLHSTGLRHRSRVRSSDSETSTPTNSVGNNIIEDVSVSAAVPRRPVARSSSNLRLAENADVAAAAAISQQQNSLHSRSSPTGTTTVGASHPASLAHGMLPLVQQALRHAAIVAGGSVNDFVPPLHRLEGMNNSQYQSSSMPPLDQYNDRTSTDFLSWILLLLGIFVLACLILF